MHLKKRGNKVLLYRSVWVRKGQEGNTHGFSRQVYVGCVDSASVQIPPELALKLTARETEVVRQKVIEPAVSAVRLAEASLQQRAKDPMWRLEEAARLLREAAALSAQARVPASRVQEASEAVAKILVIGEAARQPAKDPLREAVHAVRQAAKAVAEGHYGSAPPEGVRKSAVYAQWLELTNEVDGTARAGLLRQLQSAGWVKAKGA